MIIVVTTTVDTTGLKVSVKEFLSKKSREKVESNNCTEWSPTVHCIYHYFTAMTDEVIRTLMVMKINLNGLNIEQDIYYERDEIFTIFISTYM